MSFILYFVCRILFGLNLNKQCYHPNILNCGKYIYWSYKKYMKKYNTLFNEMEAFTSTLGLLTHLPLTHLSHNARVSYLKLVPGSGHVCLYFFNNITVYQGFRNEARIRSSSVRSSRSMCEKILKNVNNKVW